MNNKQVLVPTGFTLKIFMIKDVIGSSTIVLLMRE